MEPTTTPTLRSWPLAPLAALLILAALLGACTDDLPDGGSPFEGKKLALTAVESCTDLDGYLRGVALAELDKRYEEALSYANYYDDEEWYDYPTQSVDAGVGMEAPSSDSGAEATYDGGTTTNSGTAAPKHSTTNTQEADVDEADIVKTDGFEVYVVSGGELLIMDAFPLDELELVGAIDVPGDPFELFLGDCVVAVFSRLYTYSYDYDYGYGYDEPMPTSADVYEGTPMPDDVPETEPVESTVYDGLDGELTVVTLIDVTAPDEPTITRSLYLEGYYSSSRMIDGRIHLVLSSSLDMPYYDFYYWDGEATMEEQYTAYKEELQAMTFSDRLPQYVDVQGDEVVEGTLSSCDSFLEPTVQMGLGILAVVSIDLGSPSEPHQATSIIGDAATVYASTDNLYVASYVYDYWYWDALSSDDKADYGEMTIIHKFSLRKSHASYTASGVVDGMLLNQFSMSEHEGNLRVATTRNQWGWNMSEMDSMVSILSQTGAELAIVGSVDGIGQGEEIKSVRFLGDKGFVVTFEQIDPLFTLDLSDPTAPAVLGELEMPGFSTYLHPLDDDHLLAIGESSGTDWSINGVKLAIFDVSDMSAPVIAHELVLDAGSWSSAQYDHKAFTLYDGVLAIPTETYSWDYYDAEAPEIGLDLFDVSVSGGIAEKGFVTHTPLVQALDEAKTDEYAYYSLPSIKRSLFIDGALYSISDFGMMVHDLETLSEVGSVAFPDPGYYSYGYGYYEECWDCMP